VNELEGEQAKGRISLAQGANKPGGEKARGKSARGRTSQGANRQRGKKAIILSNRKKVIKAKMFY